MKQNQWERNDSELSANYAAYSVMLKTFNSGVQADAIINIYSLDENSELGDEYTWLSEKDRKLYTNFGYQGVFIYE